MVNGTAHLMTLEGLLKKKRKCSTCLFHSLQRQAAGDDLNRLSEEQNDHFGRLPDFKFYSGVR